MATKVELYLTNVGNGESVGASLLKTDSYWWCDSTGAEHKCKLVLYGTFRLNAKAFDGRELKGDFWGLGSSGTVNRLKGGSAQCRSVERETRGYGSVGLTVSPKHRAVSSSVFHNHTPVSPEF